jgi:4-hydroxy-tetrahydrodipicolinate reductase
MNIAVIGTGKTGTEVVKLLDAESVVGPFNSSNPPTVETLRRADVAVIFIPGSAVESILEVIMASGIPAVWGSTGYDWPEDLNERLRMKNTKWLKAANFSLGMNIIRRCIEIISRGSELLEDPAFHIHEVHHVHKKDAPSGTALSWRNWLGRAAEITSERRGDVRGVHELHMRTAAESIWLKHEAHDRSVFARGSLWAAEHLLDESIPPGLHDIKVLFDRFLEA